MLAEDLLMLLHDPETGRPLVHRSKVDLALGGAVLAELVDRQRIALTEPHRVTRNRTVVVIDPAPTGDDVLDDALRLIAARPSTRAQVVVSRISRGVRGRLLDRLAGRGLLRSQDGRFAGVLPTRTWPAVDSGPTDDVKRHLHQVLLGTRPPTRQDAAVISLLNAVGRTADVLGPGAGLDRRELKRRAEAVAGRDAAGAAVRQALHAAAF